MSTNLHEDMKTWMHLLFCHDVDILHNSATYFHISSLPCSLLTSHTVPKPPTLCIPCQ